MAEKPETHQGNPVAHEVLGSRLHSLTCSSQRKGANEIMLSQCANEQCRKPFLRLREGKLFLVERDRARKSGDSAATRGIRTRQQRHIEYYWLCDGCAQRWTLVYDHEQGIELVTLSRPMIEVNASRTRAADPMGT